MLGSCTRTSKWHLHGFRRSLFNLPDLSSMSPFGAQPVTQKYHKILPYSQRQTYDVVADVASYSGFIPFCIGSRILSSLTPEPDSSRKLTMNAELIVEFLSYKKGYISKVTCVPGESVEATTSSSLFQTLSAIWRFQPASLQSSYSPDTSLRPHTESTLVTLDLVYAFTNPIHAGICAAFSNQWSPFILKAFEERCQFLYGSHIQ